MFIPIVSPNNNDPPTLNKPHHIVAGTSVASWKNDTSLRIVKPFEETISYDDHTMRIPY